jgi:hypothetical protein
MGVRSGVWGDDLPCHKPLGFHPLFATGSTFPLPIDLADDDDPNHIDVNESNGVVTTAARSASKGVPAPAFDDNNFNAKDANKTSNDNNSDNDSDEDSGDGSEDNSDDDSHKEDANYCKGYPNDDHKVASDKEVSDDFKGYPIDAVSLATKDDPSPSLDYDESDNNNDNNNDNADHAKDTDDCKVYPNAAIGLDAVRVAQLLLTLATIWTK